MVICFQDYLDFLMKMIEFLAVEIWINSDIGMKESEIEYQKTKDILHVKWLLGHKRIENTLVYTHLVNFGSDDYICKVAHNVDECTLLIENGFEYVTEMDGMKLFRKRK